MFFLVDSMLGQPASNSLTKHHTTNCDVFVGELSPFELYQFILHWALFLLGVFVFPPFCSILKDNYPSCISFDPFHNEIVVSTFFFFFIYIYLYSNIY